MSQSDLKQILKENLYLLSPQERTAGLTLEERLSGLSPEEIKDLIEMTANKTERKDKSWKPENLLDFLLAKAKHTRLLEFLGYKNVALYQPSEIFMEKQTSDRVFWEKITFMY